MFASLSGSGFLYPFIKTCVFGIEAKTGLTDEGSVPSRNEVDSGSTTRQAIKLILCSAGLQVGILPLNKYKSSVANPDHASIQSFYC